MPAVPIIDAVAGILKPVNDIIDQFKFSGEEKAQMKLALYGAEIGMATKVLDYERAIVEAQARVIEAEATGKSWLQRNWRPMLMAEFGFIIGWNHILAPIGSWISTMFGGPELIALEMTPQFWTLLTIGVSGYIVGRSGEKITKTLVQGGGISFKKKK